MNPDVQRSSSSPTVQPAAYTATDAGSALPSGVQVGSLDNFSGTLDARQSGSIAYSEAPVRQPVISGDLRPKQWWKQNLKRSLIIILALLLLSGLVWGLKATVFRTKPTVTIPTVSNTPNFQNDSTQQNPGTVTINRDLVVTNATTFEKTITIQGSANIQKDLAVQGNGTIGGNLTVVGNGGFGGVVTAVSYIGDGSQLTGIQASNCRDCTRQQGANTVAQPGNIHIAGSIRANNFIGNGSQLTNLSANNCANCVALQPTNPGTAQNGNINVSGNVQGGTARIQGQVITGDLIPSVTGALNQGVTSAAITTTQGSGIYNDSVQWSALGPDGFVRLVYFDNNYTDLRFVRCTDVDCTGHVTTTLATFANGIDFPVISIGSDGLARILYQNYNSPRELRFIRCADADCTSRTDTQLATFAGLYEKALAIGQDGLARITYVAKNGVNSNVIFIRCTTIDCSISIATTLATGNWAFNTIMIGSDGLPRITYADFNPSPNQLIFVRCLDANCSSRNTNTVAGGVYGYNYYDVTTFGPDGLPRIAYAQNSGPSIYTANVIRCTNADCSGSVMTTVGTSTTPISIEGLAIGSDGLMRLAYDSDVKGVQYIRCTNADCTSSTSAQIIALGLGYPASFLLGPDGFGRLAYYSYSNNTLYFARIKSDTGQNTTGSSNIGSLSSPYGQLFTQSINLGDILLESTDRPKIINGISDTWLSVNAKGVAANEFVENGSSLKDKYISFGSYFQNGNIFGANQLYIPQTSNYLYRGDDRFGVTQTGFSTFYAPSLFDGVYESSSDVITAGNTGVLSIDLTAKGETTGITYTQGLITVPFYYTNIPASISARVFANGSWMNLDGRNVSNNPAYAIWQFPVPVKNYLTKIELTITAKPGVDTWLDEVEYILDRPAGEPTTEVTKYGSNRLYDILSFADSNNTVNAWINQSGAAYFNGRVGVANSTPSYPLDVTGDINSSTGLRVGGNLVCTSSGCIGGGGGPVNAYVQGGNSFGALAVLGTNDNNALAIETNGTERLWVDTSGNVGIGTTTPGQALHVNGDFIFGTAAAPSNTFSQGPAVKGLFYNDQDPGGFGYTSLLLGSKEFGSYAGADITYGYGSTANAWTSLFQAGAEINNTADISTRDYNIYDVVTHKNKLGINGNGDIAFGTMNNPNSFADASVIFKSNGYVGIGNATPGNKLDLNTLVTADNAAQLAVSTGGVNNKGIVIQAVASQNSDLLQAQDSSGTVLASIDKVGNLTVKSATINGTLTVNGHIVTANSSGTTTIAAGAAACTTPTVSVSGNDTAGTITITTGTGCAATGVLGTVTFANAYGAAPRVVLTPTNANSTNLKYYNGAANTTTFTLDTNTTPTDTTTYAYNYQVLQ